MRQSKLIILSALVISLIQPRFIHAQTFNSGSTGADGAFSPAASVVLEMPPDGVFNFTTINVPSGVLVTFNKNAANTPVTLLASGDVTINGSISVNGTSGQISSGAVRALGGKGGPGGFDGGEGGLVGGTSTAGSPGRGPGGGEPNGIGIYGAAANFVSLMPLFGGSGGGGGFAAGSTNGGGGGGGGGAILIASSGTLTINGSITAIGGQGSTALGTARGGIGSGGAIRLVAHTINGTGSLVASTTNPNGVSSSGRTRLEAYQFSFAGGGGSVAFAPGPISAASSPSLLGGLPTLTFTSIGGVVPPSTLTGAYATPDVQLASGTTNPVPVSLAAANTPVGTVFSVRVLPFVGSSTTFSSSPSTGTFTSSTASADLTLPQNQASILIAFANFTIPLQTAALLPRIDGEEIDRLMLASQPGEGSALHFVTKSRREVPAREIVGEEMLAMLWREVALSQ
ncbi:MAG: hypothetical protein LLH30_13250 [Candidatus Manganitrophus sp. SA1]|nr:hypothetical protein [Candidatus Manganitrophus morganii]